MCNNNGHCRKFDAGTMCPSFRATGDEQHLTRGRANTLRLALSGQLSGDDWATDDVFNALDLCVSCKGCKRECPTGVDMARMKIEFLHHYRKRTGRPLAEKLVAHLPRYAPWAARLPWLFNARDAVPGMAALTEGLTGLSARRRLPRWRSDTFFRDVRRAGAPGRAGRVVLLVDTFNNYFEPENARAALRVLEAAGYEVEPARAPQGERPLCCGRSYLAKGMIAEAKVEARRMIEALRAHGNAPVVGLEPACLLTLRDELQLLLPGPEAAALGERAMLFEEFLAREQAAGRLSLALRPLPEKKALLHGHCHQKAFGAMSAVEQALRLVPELNVETIETSCCGMAGSFGYEAGHYDVSMKMAELSLLPKVRAAGADTVIVADGTSCRHQIGDGASREALHVARVLERAL
jgi:Fe-S oxidoreductase